MSKFSILSAFKINSKYIICATRNLCLNITTCVQCCRIYKALYNSKHYWKYFSELLLCAWHYQAFYQCFMCFYRIDFSGQPMNRYHCYFSFADAHAEAPSHHIYHTCCQWSQSLLVEEPGFESRRLVPELTHLTIIGHNCHHNSKK